MPRALTGGKTATVNGDSVHGVIGWTCVGHVLARHNARACTCKTRQTRRISLATRKELSDFLASVERRAFKQMLFAVRDEQFALDIVQDAMMKLAEKYSARPDTELPMLFQRILQNTMRDHFRRQKVRNLWTTQVSSLSGPDDGDDHDPLETLAAAADSNPQEAPSDQLQQSQTLEIIEKAIRQLAGTSTPGLPPALLGGNGRCGGGERHGLLGGKRENALLAGPCTRFPPC